LIERRGKFTLQMKEGPPGNAEGKPPEESTLHSVIKYMEAYRREDRVIVRGWMRSVKGKELEGRLENLRASRTGRLLGMGRNSKRPKQRNTNSWDRKDF